MVREHCRRYSATKGAILALVQQFAFEFAPDVRVNGVVLAGIARSQLRGPASLGMDNLRQSDIPEDAFLAKFRSISLLQDLPEPGDYAIPYLFPASRQTLTELAEHDGGRSGYRDWLGEHGESMHHGGFRLETMDEYAAARDHYARAGLVTAEEGWFQAPDDNCKWC